MASMTPEASSLAGHAHLHGRMGAHAQEDGPEALPFQVGQSQVRAETHAGADLDAQADDVGDLPVQDLGRQPVVRDAHAKHAAQDRQGFEQGDLVPP